MERPVIKPFAWLLSLVAENIRSTWQAWDDFWFSPLQPESLGVLRIFGGGMILYTHVVWGLRLEAFFGPDGWQDPLLVSAVHRNSTALSFWTLVPVELLWPVHLLCLAVITLFVLGCCTRWTSILTSVIVISYANRVPLANFGLDQINCLIALYLAMSPCGAAFSLDALAQRFGRAYAAASAGRQPVFDPLPAVSSARFASRMIQVHMCILYFWAGVSKLKGVSWWNGEAIWLGAANSEYRSGDLTWLAWYPLLGNFLTHATVVWEATYWVFVFKPRFKWLVLATGVGMHVGIGAFLGMWTFGLVMIFTYISYVPPETCNHLLDRLAQWTGSAKSLRLEYRPERFLECLLVAARCTCSWGRPLQLAPLTSTGLANETPLPMTPGAWWRWWQEQEEPGWPFPVQGGDSPAQRQLLIVTANVEYQVKLQTYFTKHHYYSRVAPDVPFACACLSSKPVDCVLILLEDRESIDDVVALRRAFVAAGKMAPASVVAVHRSLQGELKPSDDSRHRITRLDCQCRDLRREVAIACGWSFEQPLNTGEAVTQASGISG